MKKKKKKKKCGPSNGGKRHPGPPSRVMMKDGRPIIIKWVVAAGLHADSCCKLSFAVVVGPCNKDM